MRIGGTGCGAGEYRHELVGDVAQADTGGPMLQQLISIQLKISPDLEMDKTGFRGNRMKKKKKCVIGILHRCGLVLQAKTAKSVNTHIKEDYFLFAHKQNLEHNTTNMT